MLEKTADYDPAEYEFQKEGLSIAYLRMMGNLSPDERAVLLLREVFDFSYLEIATILEKKEENCRKVFSRAKKKIFHMEGESLNYERNKSIIHRFIEAFQTQNTKELLELVSENVTLFSDGGGKVKAAVRPVATFSNVLAFLYGIVKKAPEDFYFEIKNVNGQPAIVNYSNGILHSIISFYICGDIISELFITLNPDKLKAR